MPKFYTSVILLINQSKEIGEKQFSGFGSRGGQNRPIMHIPPLQPKVQCLSRHMKFGTNHIVKQMCRLTRAFYACIKQSMDVDEDSDQIASSHDVPF